eukprot:CAMPEP_0184559188 /NCGR_PEP_ID=MMETSP0199_2-20130426/46302_1 /TAXON_ID=1112570 /ORGANISM="Thraustochytrium sp., Strain LLF1b" /LENGTH=376 /DNA_ID=CAMNT_0026956473 /DNA_START=768 /DNA_END=1897 /DNA_ORIENTATION=-
MSMVGVPPGFEESDLALSKDTASSSSFLGKHGKLLRTVAALGVTDSSAIDVARSELKGALLEGNPILNNITVGELQILIEAYQADPAAWKDQYLSASVMESLVVYNSQGSGEDARRLGQGRSLIGDYDVELVSDVWELVELYEYNINVDNDDFLLQVEDDRCLLIGATTDQAADWFANIDVGSDDILAVTKTNERAEECGCEQSTLWWCSRYKSCSTYRTLGSGYDGFVKAYNNARLTLTAALEEKGCSSKSQVVFGGHSRGSALVSVLAYAMVKDGIFASDQLTLVTFGSPRVFEDDISDDAHGLVKHWRMVYGSDLVTSIPYDWWGYKHFGTMRCAECNYDEGRDRPYAATGIEVHSNYCKVFGDLVCTYLQDA